MRRTMQENDDDWPEPSIAEQLDDLRVSIREEHDRATEHLSRQCEAAQVVLDDMWRKST